MSRVECCGRVESISSLLEKEGLRKGNKDICCIKTSLKKNLLLFAINSVQYLWESQLTPRWTQPEPCDSTSAWSTAVISALAYGHVFLGHDI